MKVRTLKKDMQKYGILILLLLLFSNLTACGSQNTLSDKEPEVSQNKTEEGTTGTTEDDIEAEQSAASKESDDTESRQDAEASQMNGADFDREAMKNTYTSILEGIYYNHTFPDGQACDWEDNGDISQNRFSVFDIDQDGKEELILEYINGSMAGMVALIYDFDNNTKTANEEFREFPALTYYDNGVIQAEWSHNQGLAGDFWPYTLYQFDRESDSYVNVGMVDAWDRSLSETDYNGDPFPSESDTDGDGIVYYIMQDGEYELDHPVDWAEYKQWRDSYMGNAKEVKVPFVNLTEENIDDIQ
ncbi:hypothetical protein [Clostridium sp. Marseille-P2415]|uniref:hypothetical protein n=1 Tax=Clostridium sp. Marseille-P2415 TaxID=1805471 RepID=UPI0009885AA8|nr:hypothetical protein [Clostridium sp. Marseille-P2415]